MAATRVGRANNKVLPMRLLIDGYNVIYTAGVPGRGFGIGMVERGRLGLLKLLAEALPPAERAETVVVFDARGAPPGLPRELIYCGMRVRFAPRSLTADDVIEELIRQEPAPGGLTVVSSDRRIQHAARRRSAKAIDSHAWYESLRARKRRRAQPAEAAKPTEPPLDAEVARWLAEFGGEDIVQTLQSEEKPLPPGKALRRPTRSIAPASHRQTAAHSRPRAPKRHIRPGRLAAEGEVKPVSLDNPFPPGYGEDVLDEP